MPEQKKVRSLAAAAFRAGGVKLRKGHWRRPHAELAWYADLRADSPRPDAELTLEIGLWVPDLGLGAEAEGGAVDCPLLLDRPIVRESNAAVTEQIQTVVAMFDRLGTLADVAAARAAGQLDGAMIDPPLAARLG